MNIWIGTIHLKKRENTRLSGDIFFRRMKQKFYKT